MAETEESISPLHSLSEEEKNRILMQLDKAEWALRCLSAGKRKALEKYLTGLTANYRVVTHKEQLESLHASAQFGQELLDCSEPAGIIRAGVFDGKPQINVVSFADNADPNASRLLAESQREILSELRYAVGFDLNKRPKTATAVVASDEKTSAK